MKLAAISCANGLGHLKRLVRILNQLVDRGLVRSVALYCDVNGLQQISSWREYLRLQERCIVEIVNVSVPIRWKLDQGDYTEWLLDWHSVIPSWRLGSFDHVLSDNLVEPLHYSRRVTLIGSFFWHDVLSSAFAESKDIEKYKSFCESLLASSIPHVIANRYFATSTVLEQTNLHLVGLVPFSPVRKDNRANEVPRRVLIAMGGAQLSKGVEEVLVGAIERMVPFGMEVFASNSMYRSLRPLCPEIQQADFADDSFETYDLAIIRGGLGTISDCIASKVPMLYVNDPNPEIRHNQARLVEMGIGIPLDKFLNDDSETLTSQLVYRRMVSNMANLNLNGHIEAGEILAGLWESPQVNRTVTCTN